MVRWPIWTFAGTKLSGASLSSAAYAGSSAERMVMPSAANSEMI